MSSELFFFSFPLSKMDGESCLPQWRGGLVVCKMTVSSNKQLLVKLEVNNIMVDRKILNIFGAITGFEEPGNSNRPVAQTQGEHFIFCDLRNMAAAPRDNLSSTKTCL